MALASLFLPCAPSFARGGTGGEAFFLANRDFQGGRYAEAARGYGELLSSGRASGHVYYNLGTALLRMGRPGPAILNYERAKLLIPRDGDLAFNLSYALSRTNGAAAPPGQAISSVLFWLQPLNLPELFRVFAVFQALLFASAALRLFFRRDLTCHLLMVCLFLWFTAALSYGLKYYETAADRRAIVVSKTTDALAGPENGDTVLFRLAEGMCVTKERSEPPWSLVSLPDGKRGWVKAGDVEEIVDGNLKARLLPF